MVRNDRINPFHLVGIIRASGMAEGSGRFLRWADRPGACRRAGRNPGQEAGERQQAHPKSQPADNCRHKGLVLLASEENQARRGAQARAGKTFPTGGHFKRRPGSEPCGPSCRADHSVDESPLCRAHGGALTKKRAVVRWNSKLGSRFPCGLRWRLTPCFLR